MRATVSGTFDFTGMRVTGDDRVGEPGSYEREPRFTAGAWRFTAVQLGGVQALLMLLRDHLRTSGAAEDPIHRARFGQAVIAARNAALWVDKAAVMADIVRRVQYSRHTYDLRGGGGCWPSADGYGCSHYGHARLLHQSPRRPHCERSWLIPAPSDAGPGARPSGIRVVGAGPLARRYPMVSIGEASHRACRLRARAIAPAHLHRMGRWLFLVPHPDDEVLGCGGLLSTLTSTSARPLVVYLTNGAASHLGSPAWPQSRLAAARRSEALASLRLLGVPPRDVFWLDWPDARPHATSSRAFAASRDRIQRLLLGHRHSRCSLYLERRAALRPCRRPRSGTCGLRSFPRLYEYLVWGWIRPDLTYQPEDVNPRV